MSASREKKERQGAGPNLKEATAAEQAAAQKRKTIQYTVIGVVIAVLVAALLFWDSGIIQRSSTAVTIGDTGYSAAEVNYYYNSAFQTTYLYAQYGLNTYDITSTPEKQVYSMDAATGETITYADYFAQTAMDNLLTITALYDAAIAAGYSEADVADVVDAEMDALKSSASSGGYSSVKQLLISYYGKTVTPGIYEEIVTRQAIADAYLTDYTESLEYGDEALNAYYEENADDLDTLEYTYLYFAAATVETTDEEGNELSEEEIAAAKEQALSNARAKADQAAQLLRDGSDANDVVTELSPTSSYVDNVSLGSSVNANISEWMLDESRQPGDIDVIEYGDNGYYTVVFTGRYIDETPSVNVRHILIQAELDEGATVPTAEQLAAAKTRAEDLLSQWQTGEATEESFAALAEEHSTDTGSNTNGGLYEEVLPGDFVTNFNNWLFEEGDRQPGDVAVLENTGDNATYHGYHITYFSEINEGDFAWKHTATSVMANADTDEWLTNLESQYTVTEKSGMKYVG